jgi:hypothetical protein
MASDEALEDSRECKETSTELLEESLGGQQVLGLTEASELSEESLGGQQVLGLIEASLSHEVASDNESQSGGSEENERGSDHATHLKVAATAALAGVSYNFGQLTMMKTHLVSLRNNSHYFPKRYGRPSAERCSRVQGFFYC